jgi:hypothetical protein
MIVLDRYTSRTPLSLGVDPSGSLAACETPGGFPATQSYVCISSAGWGGVHLSPSRHLPFLEDRA